MTMTEARPTPTTETDLRPSPMQRWAALDKERTAYVVLLGASALLYLWGLGASGYANSFYSAAAQAGSESWKAFFFGASDAAGSITVDKPPLSIWPMALSVKVFGLSSWSILVPQALMGVGTVALLHATVRRATGSGWAGLIAGAALATTPVAVLMFRFNNPDALLVLLMTGAAYAVVRALESPRALRWLVLGGALIGLAFLTKTLQAFLVLPALALAYALFATVPWRTRIGHLLAAFGAMVAAAGWWVAVVELWPASSRPYIGGSQTNDFLELTFGYNGFGRLTGDEAGSVGGGNGWGSTGLLRLFGTDNGGQVAWLIPAALILGAGALWCGSRMVRALTTLLLGWLVVTAVTFSLMAGIYHAYYTVALAPAIAGLVGLGGWELWKRRESLVATALLGGATAMTAVFAFALLDRTPDFAPWLGYLVLVVGLLAAFLLVCARHLPRRLASVVAITALLTGLAGPTAYALQTASTPHTGSIPTAGPSSTDGFGAGLPGGLRGGPQGQTGPGATGGTTTGGVGGLLDGSSSTPAVTSLLLADADSYTWVAAAVGANSAAGYQLATEESVMPIGGFNGSDPSPTLAEFQDDVAAGEIHYFISGGRARWWPGRTGWQREHLRDRDLGRGDLRLPDGRRRDALRPVGGLTATPIGSGGIPRTEDFPQERLKFLEIALG